MDVVQGGVFGTDPAMDGLKGIIEHVESFVRDGWLHGNIRAERVQPQT